MQTECADVRAALRRGEPPDGPELAAHVAGCPACATLAQTPALAAGLDAIDVDADGVEALLQRTLVDLDGERGPVARLRSMATTFRLALALVVMIAIPGVVLALAPRPDLGVYPGLRLVVDFVLYAIPGLLAVVAALWPLYRNEPIRARAITVIASVVAALLVASLPAAHADHAASLAGAGDDFAKRALGCFIYGSICALPAFAALRLLGREGARVGSTALVIGVAAALCGSAAVFLHCPIAHASHRWAGHVAVLLPALAWALWHGLRSRRR